jgi:hypothetical protein
MIQISVLKMKIERNGCNEIVKFAWQKILLNPDSWINDTIQNISEYIDDNKECS